MRQISQSYRSGKLAIVDVAPPRAPAGGILVSTRVSLISAGTERAIVDLARKSLLEKARERPDLVAKVVDKARREGVLAALDSVKAKLDNAIPLGYSLAGRVAGVGAGVTEFADGDRVACAGAGYANHAESNAVPRNLAVHVPEGVSDEEASFVTVGAIALHGVRLLRPALGEVVVVIGLGLIGQIAVQLLTAHGCDVVGIDVDRSKVDRAIARGAVGAGVTGVDDCVEMVRAVSGGRGADGVLITASSPNNEPLKLAGEVARDRAVVSIVGLMPIDVPRKAYFDKELRVVVSRSYGPGRYDPEYEERGHDYPVGYVRWTERRNLEAVLHAIATKRLEVASLMTHRFPFEKALDAYELITAEKPEPHLGVLLTYQALTNGHAGPVTAPVPRRRPRSGVVGLAVVGTGSFAIGVLLPKIKDVPAAHLVATASGRGLSARQAADRFKAERVATDLGAALAMDDVDAVVIATRHGAHADQACQALAAGRDVFLEKPAAVDEEQLTRLSAAVRGSGAFLMLGFNRRFAPFARRVRETFSGRKAGLVMNARINAGRLPGGSWIMNAAEGGGRIVGECCHFVDLFSFWAGASPVRVTAHAIGPGGAEGRDENVIVGLTFGDGSVATLTYTAMGDASVGKERYEVFCEGKVAILEDWKTLAITSRGKTQTTRALRADKGHGEEMRSFVEACANGAPSPTPWDGVEAVTRATFAMERAWVEGCAVEIG